MPYSDPQKQKEAVSKHYSKHKDQALRSMQASRARKLEKLAEAKSGPCADCGKCYPPRVMEFHHSDPSEKDFTIGKMFHKWGWNRILIEIQKCVLLCANCHRLRH